MNHDEVIKLRMPLYKDARLPVVFTPDDDVPGTDYIVDVTMDFGNITGVLVEQEVADKWVEICNNAKYIACGNQSIEKAYLIAFRNKKIVKAYGGVTSHNPKDAPSLATGVLGYMPSEVFSLEWANDLYAGVVRDKVVAFAPKRNSVKITDSAKPQTKKRRRKKKQNDEEQPQEEPAVKSIVAYNTESFSEFADNITELIALYPGDTVISDTVAIALATIGIPIFMRLRPYMTGSYASLYAIGGIAGPTMTVDSVKKQIEQKRNRYNTEMARIHANNINNETAEVLSNLR